MTKRGIMGAGEIARVFANGVRFSRTGKVVAVASRTAGRGESLAKDFSIPRCYARYEELLADREVQAVYVSLIHPPPCPVGHRGGVFLMEAFMYRCHPQMARLTELIAGGAIGQVLMIRATFSFAVPCDESSRLFNKELGGGSILDVGCYPASMSRFIAGAAIGKPFADPVAIKACGVIGQHEAPGPLARRDRSHLSARRRGVMPAREAPARGRPLLRQRRRETGPGSRPTTAPPRSPTGGRCPAAG